MNRRDLLKKVLGGAAAVVASSAVVKDALPAAMASKASLSFPGITMEQAAREQEAIRKEVAIMDAELKVQRLLASKHTGVKVDNPYVDPEQFKRWYGYKPTKEQLEFWNSTPGVPHKEDACVSVENLNRRLNPFPGMYVVTNSMVESALHETYSLRQLELYMQAHFTSLSQYVPGIPDLCVVLDNQSQRMAVTERVCSPRYCISIDEQEDVTKRVTEALVSVSSSLADWLYHEHGDSWRFGAYRHYITVPQLYYAIKDRNIELFGWFEVCVSGPVGNVGHKGVKGPPGGHSVPWDMTKCWVDEVTDADKTDILLNGWRPKAAAKEQA